ncbi:hypothetical protein DRE_04678 [Drechslerella stenobrocha 248]|uniref:Uncharacterized protein n=1 Tax=Drechslerella stenobrocha 248 TaxID=1043628 RepID=W7HSB8_9PEZI|nr:hypothetical protein DRE_04678 [Drechslerella stenobrocha 248]
MSTVLVNFDISPPEGLQLPKITDKTMFNQIVTFKFTRSNGGRHEPLGSNVKRCRLDAPFSVLREFARQTTHQFSVARRQMLIDFIKDAMTNETTGHRMASHYELGKFLVLKDVQDRPVSMPKVLARCWQRYMFALKVQDPIMMALFLRRLFMPAIEELLYAARVLDESKRVVYSQPGGSSTPTTGAGDIVGTNGVGDKKSDEVKLGENADDKGESEPGDDDWDDCAGEFDWAELE